MRTVPNPSSNPRHSPNVCGGGAMNTATKRYFAERDNRPPPGVRPMVVRRTETWRNAQYTIIMDTSCGSGKPHVSGSVRIKLFDNDDPANALATKRFAAEDWYEAHTEFVRLRLALRKGG